MANGGTTIFAAARAAGVHTAAGAARSAAAGEGGVGRELEVVVGQEFEEALELKMEVAKMPFARAKNFRIELTIDRNPEKSLAEEAPEPPASAVVKRLDMGPDNPVMIQNMPSGRHFLVAAVALLSTGREVRSRWVPAKTLPLTKATPPARDLLGSWRGRCKLCPCQCFKLMSGNQFSLNSSPTSAVCRGCGCQASQHEKFEKGLDLEEKAWGKAAESAAAAAAATGEGSEGATGGEGKSKDGTAADAAADEVPLPAESQRWSGLEKELFQLSHGGFHPGNMAKLRRLPANPAEEAGAPAMSPAGQQGGSSSSRSGAAAAGVRQGVRGRISVVCPTMQTRRVFHEQLWAVFEAQAWPDKELIVVETYKVKPSSFLEAKAKEDPRLIYVPLQIRPSQGDLSIGLKRNMCTHLASGEILANFDDDDVYAPSYLRTMAEAIKEGSAAGATLASWYVFDVDCGKFGFVDPVKAKELGTPNAPRDIDDWLYGYGFSYAFTLEAACAHPYPNRNLGEDMEFFSALRRPARGGVKLVFDSYGICVHTLHARSTSNNWAQREVTREELEDLDIADLSEVLVAYLNRVPAQRSKSDFIEAKIERRQRKLRVATAVGEFSVRCNAGVRAQDVLDLLAKQVGSMAKQGRLFRAPAEGPLAAERPPERDALEPGERVGLRTERLYADLDTGGKEVLVKVTDLRDRSISVSVRLPHQMVQLQAVREALVAQHAAPGKKVVAKEIRLAELVGSNFLSVDFSRWLGDIRTIFSPGLAELLDRTRVNDD